MATVNVLCLAISSPRSQVNERRRGRWELTAQCGHDSGRVFAGHFYQRGKNKLPFRASSGLCSTTED
jgi:hypothetical protein